MNVKKEFRQKLKFGRPLLIELPFYCLIEGFLAFCKGIKRGYRMFKNLRAIRDR